LQFKFSYRAANTQYYYLRVRAYSIGSSWSGYLKYSCTGGNPPSAPSNLSATPISSTQINLSWRDNANNETGFKIERRIGGGSYSQIATLGANVTSYQDTGLTPNTTYYYRIRAYNSYGDSAYSNEASAITFAAGSVQGAILPIDGSSPINIVPFRDEYVNIGATRVTTNSNGQYSANTGGNITSSLQGPYVNVANNQGPEASYGPTYTTTWTWNYTPDLPNPDINNHFDEVNVFYHINNIHQWFKGLNVSVITNLTDIMDVQVPVDVHYLYIDSTGQFPDWGNAECEWQPRTNEIRLRFGHGNAHIGRDVRDLAKASEVIYHEYGHGIVFRLRGIFGEG
jgi:hypothetical protein